MSDPTMFVVILTFEPADARTKGETLEKIYRPKNRAELDEVIRTSRSPRVLRIEILQPVNSETVKHLTGMSQVEKFDQIMEEVDLV